MALKYGPISAIIGTLVPSGTSGSQYAREIIPFGALLHSMVVQNQRIRE